MSLMADALQPLFVRGILTISGRVAGTSVPDALISPRAAYDLDFDGLSQTILFDFRDPTLVTTATAFDCCRFSGSAFQTVSSVATTTTLEKDALPWEIIKLYYSAFYTGQTIIRLLGEGCSFLDSRHVARIDAFAKATGKVPGFSVDAGLYRCAIDTTGTKLTCLRIVGGTHESFWNVFGEKIESATAGVLQGPLVQKDAQAVFAQLEALSRLVKRHGSYRWLSTMRNDLQYRHYYDVWHPSGIGKQDRRTLHRLVLLWKSDPMSVDLDAVRFGLLGEFIVACAFIVGVCRVLLIRIAERSPQSQSFLRYGPLAYMAHN
jgi:hypothetical protein